MGRVTAGGLAAGEWTLASILKQAGYSTCQLGKWHLSEADYSMPIASMRCANTSLYHLNAYTGTVALRHPCARQGMITRDPRWSYGDCQVVKGLPWPVETGDVGGNVVVAAPQILHEGMTGRENPR